MNCSTLNTKLLAIIKYVFALIILFFSVRFILNIFDLEDLWLFLNELKIIRFVIVNSVLLLLYWFLRTLRWRLLLQERRNEEFSLFELYKIIIFSLSIAVISPFQSGEVLKIAMLKEQNSNYDVGFLTKVFFVEKIQDFLFLFFVFFIGSYFYGVNLIEKIRLNNLVLFLLIVLQFFLLGVSLYLLKKHEIAFGKAIFFSFFYTVLSWFAMGFIWHNSLICVGLDVSVFQIQMLISTIMLATLFSFLPAGIGAAEVSAFVIFTELGVVEQTAKLGVISLRMMGLYSVFFGVLFYVLLKVAGRQRKTERN